MPFFFFFYRRNVKIFQFAFIPYQEDPYDKVIPQVVNVPTGILPWEQSNRIVLE